MARVAPGDFFLIFLPQKPAASAIGRKKKQPKDVLVRLNKLTGLALLKWL